MKDENESPRRDRFEKVLTDPFGWARAAKAASRATAVLAAWGGPGREPERDAEALGALAAFASETGRMDRGAARLACDMLWIKALRCADMGRREWGEVVSRAVGGLDGDDREKARAALVSAGA